MIYYFQRKFHQQKKMNNGKLSWNEIRKEREKWMKGSDFRLKIIGNGGVAE